MIDSDTYRDVIVKTIYDRAQDLSRRAVTVRPSSSWEETLDNLLMSPWTGFPIMLTVLGAVLWVTVVGANYPSELLAGFLFWLQDQLAYAAGALGIPAWLRGFLIDGVYRGLAWVVSVMLPPMAIFFPCFTILEDLGFLPRVAFNLDALFKKVGSHGKQSLTMSMGFGCNAAGVIASRIIESPRERLIAILTNNFIPCNGRFPLLIALSTIFLGGGSISGLSSAALVVVLLVIFGILVSLGVSWILSRTLLRGIPSSFSLELPPFRRPKVGAVIVRSVHDRTLFVLRRAVVIAAPAGGLVYILANASIGESSLLNLSAAAFDPVARLVGLDGFILLAFFLALPANEIFLPILLMGYLSAGVMTDYGSLDSLRRILVEEHGWTWLTALSVMLFSLLHFPCGTTLLTIGKETGTFKWSAVAFLLTTGTAFLVLFLVRVVLGQVIG